jgi:holin-like protein
MAPIGRQLQKKSALAGRLAQHGALYPLYHEGRFHPGAVSMLAAITLLLLFQLAGEAIALLFALPIPGPVIGMGLLFATLAWRGGPSPELRNTAQNLLQHLSLLFVPAGVGVMLHLQRMADEWLPIVVALVVSTFVTIAVTALVLRALHVHEKEQP